MGATNLDCWVAVISDAPASVIDKLGNLFDFSNPPDLYEFVCRQWERRNEPDAAGWNLLMDGQIMLRIVGTPDVLELNKAITLTQYALQVDPLFDSKLLRRLLANRLWPEEVPSDEVMRTLEVLERLNDPHRLSMTLLKFSKFPDRYVQSKVAKLLGRCVESREVMEELLTNPDARVRANLLEGLCRRENINPFRDMIERAAVDQNQRVSSLALALKSRLGHSGSMALLKMRSNSKVDGTRRSAEFALKVASGHFNPYEKTAESAAAVSTEPAVAAAVNEVHQQA